MSERLKGYVLWFSDPKGYGFICPDGYKPNENDIFFYFRYLQMDGFKTVKPGARVSFEVGDNHRGPMAVNIVIESNGEQEDTEE